MINFNKLCVQILDSEQRLNINNKYTCVTLSAHVGDKWLKVCKKLLILGAWGKESSQFALIIKNLYKSLLIKLLLYF